MQFCPDKVEKYGLKYVIMFHLYWYLYYGMNALKWFIIYQFAKLNISCICSPSMKSSLFLYHAMTSACRCLERKQDYVTWKKLTLNFTCWEQNVVVKGKYPELRRNYMHLHDLEHHYLNRKVFSYTHRKVCKNMIVVTSAMENLFSIPSQSSSGTESQR